MPNLASDLAIDEPGLLGPGQIAEDAIEGPLPDPEGTASPSPSIVPLVPKATPDTNIRAVPPAEDAFNPDAYHPDEPSDASGFNPDTYQIDSLQNDALSDYKKMAPLAQASMEATEQMQQGMDAYNNYQDSVKDFDPDAYTVEPNEPSSFSGGLHSIREAFGNSFFQGLGQTARMAGVVLGQMAQNPPIPSYIPRDSVIDQSLQSKVNPEEIMAPYNSAADAVEAYAKTYQDDPKYPITNAIGHFTGSLAPIIGATLAGSAAGNPELGILGASGLMGGQMGGQGYEEAKSRGATENNAVNAALGDALVGAGTTYVAGPLGGKLFGEAPAVASSSWSQLAGRVAKGSLAAGSKSFLDFSAMNLATGEIDNAVAADSQKQSQYDIVKNALVDALPGLVVGPAMRGVEQIGAEHAVSQAAKESGQSKADFIANTAQAFDNLAQNSSMSPQDKVVAATAYLNQFSPQVRKTLVAHVQNVKSTIDAIQAADATMAQLDPTNPLTADALSQEQKNAALNQGMQTAVDIEKQADEHEQAALDALNPKEAEVVSEADPPQVSNPELPKIQTATDEQLSENLANAQKWLGDESVKSNPEEIKFWQDAADSIQAEQQRRSQPDPTHIVHYDEYGNAYKVPVEVSKAANEAAIEHPETEPLNVQIQTENPAKSEPIQSPANPETTPEEAVEPQSTSEQGAQSKSEETSPNSEEPKSKGIAPATYLGKQEIPGMEPFHLYNLTDDIPGHPKGSTVSEKTLRDAGYEIPPEPTSKSEAIVTEGKNREELEQIAQNEGHRADDVAQTKSNQGLRDLIETKRVGQTPTDRDTGLVQDGPAMIDPKIEQLPSRYKKAVQSFIGSSKKWGLRGVKKFIIDTRSDTGHSVAVARVRDGHFDTVYINPINLVRNMDFARTKGQSKADIDHLHQLVFSEEFAHTQIGRVIQKDWEKRGKQDQFSDYYDNRMQAVYDKMTPKQRAETQTKYGTKLSPPSLAEEYVRQVIQRRSGRGVTEDAIQRVYKNKPIRTMVQGLVNRLRGFAEQLAAKGKSDSELELLIHDYQRLIGSKEVFKSSQESAGGKTTASAPLTEEENKASLDYDTLAAHQSEQETTRRARAGYPAAGADLLRRSLGADQEKLGDFLSRPDQERAYLKIAQDNGKVLSSDFLKDAKSLAAQGEHEVFVKGDRVYKITQDHGDFDYGTGIGQDYKTTPYQYLNRFGLVNRIFGDDIKWEGVIPSDYHLRTVTSQPFYKGNIPDESKINAKLTDMGFEYHEIPGKLYGQEPDRIWYRPSDGIILGDTKPANFIETPDGSIRPIDVIAEKATEKQKADFGLKKPTGSSPLAPESTHDAYEDYLTDPEHEPEPKAALRPFLTPGERALEVASRPNEEGNVSDRANERERELSNQIEALKHVEVPEQEQSRLQDMAHTLSALHFGADAKNRDIAEGNAFVKALVEAKKWIEQSGSLNAKNDQGKAFSARKVIQNSLLDDGRRAAKQSQLMESASPEEEKVLPPALDEEGNVVEPPEMPKGYDASNQDYEAQQNAFEPTGNQGNEGATTETPSSKAQSKIVDQNIKDVTSQLSSYGKRLLELWNDYPENWANRAQKEFDIPKAQAEKDFEEVKSRLSDEVKQRGLTADDFNRATGSAALTPEDRPERFSERVSQDERIPDDIRKAVFDRTYTPIPNDFAVKDALASIEKDGLQKSYERIMNPDPKTSELNDDQRVTMGQLVTKKLVQEGGVDNLKKAVDVVNTLSSYGTKLGRAVQRFRLWNELGPDGIVLKYGQIVKPSIDAARKPFEEEIGKIKGGLAEARESTVNDLLGRPKTREIIDAAERTNKKNKENEIPIWQRYKNATFDTLSNILRPGIGKSEKGALEEFASRFGQTMKTLLKEDSFQNSSKKPGFGTENTIREIYNNLPEYKKSWDEAKNFIEAKYGHDPEFIQSIDGILNKAFDVPAKFTNKLLTENIQTKGIDLKELVKKWSGDQGSTRDQLIKDIQNKIGLSPEHSELLGNALASRFNAILEKTRQTQLSNLVKRLGKPRLANQSTSLAKKIIEASNLGATDDEAAYTAIADAYGLPKFDPKIATDLKARANEIQKMIADGKEGFQTDLKTQDMLNILANEEDKNKSYWKQGGNAALAIYYGNILGPTTLIRKTISEVGQAIGEVTTMSAAEMRHDPLALPRSIMAFGRGLYDRGGVDARNILLSGHGLRQGEPDYTHGGRAFERGKPLGDIPVLNLANKPLSVFYRYVGRSLEAGASFFYAGANEARANMLAYRLAKEDMKNGKVPQEWSINQRMAEILGNTPELRAKFEQQAANEGLTGRDASLRVAELIENTRPDDLRKQANDFALRARFGQEPEGMLGEMSRRLLQFTNKYPAMKVLVPFTRIPANVLNTTLDYTPWGYRRAYAWDSIRGNNDRFYQQLIKATGGTIATTALAALFSQYADDKDPQLMVSADGPADFNKKQQLMQQGWTPYSIKIGNHYVGYREWPIGLGLATLGKYFDSHRYGNFKSDDAATRWAFTGLSLANELVTRSWMSNVNDFLDIVKNNNPDRAQQAFEQFAGRTAGSFIPFNQSAVRILDKMWDPNHYSGKTLLGIMASQVPIARSMNQPAVNALGDVIQERPFMAFAGTKTEDPTWQALSEKGIFIPAIANSQPLGDRTMTQEEHYRYAVESGQAVRQALENGGLDKMAGMDTDQAQDYLNALVRVARTPIKAELHQEALDAGTIHSDSRHRR